VYIMKFA